MYRYLTLAAVLACTTPTLAEDKPVSAGGLAHVVFFKMKADTPAAAVDEVIADCKKILAKIPAVRSVKVGRPTKEKAEKFVKDDYDVALIVMVDDYKGLLAYHKDPLHLKFVEKHGKLFDLDTLRVFDFIQAK